MSTSLLAPAVLLAAALLVAVGGAGADAFGSLAQLTRGPNLPLSSVEQVSRGATRGADLTELEGQLSASAPRDGQAATPGRAARRTGEAPRAAKGSSGSSGRQAGSGTGSGSPSSGPAETPAGGQGSAPTAPAPSTSPGNSAPSAPTKPNPVGDTLDQTQQDLDNLLKPVKPITDQVLGGLGR